MVLPGLLMAHPGGARVRRRRLAAGRHRRRPVASGPDSSRCPSTGAGLPEEACPRRDGPGVRCCPADDRPQRPPRPASSAADTLAAWAAPLAVRTNIPLVALEAYALAELTVTAEHARPATCAGRRSPASASNESNHGQPAARRSTTDGRSSPPIYGPPLDGTDGNKAIQDTDDGQLDGDQAWDRAIGPMQFIPTTWNKYAVDADGNGVADPHDIDDAALASAQLPVRRWPQPVHRRGLEGRDPGIQQRRGVRPRMCSTPRTTTGSRAGPEAITIGPTP